MKGKERAVLDAGSRCDLRKELAVLKEKKSPRLVKMKGGGLTNHHIIEVKPGRSGSRTGRRS